MDEPPTTLEAELTVERVQVGLRAPVEDPVAFGGIILPFVLVLYLGFIGAMTGGALTGDLPWVLVGALTPTAVLVVVALAKALSRFDRLVCSTHTLSIGGLWRGLEVPLTTISDVCVDVVPRTDVAPERRFLVVDTDVATHRVGSTHTAADLRWLARAIRSAAQRARCAPTDRGSVADVPDVLQHVRPRSASER